MADNDPILHRASDLFVSWDGAAGLWLQSYESAARMRASALHVALLDAFDGERPLSQVLLKMGVPAEASGEALGLIEELLSQGFLLADRWSSRYFEAFTIESHHAMLMDSRRVGAYREAIVAAVRPGDVVVDLGTGSGILACLAAQAGARRVYAVEASPAIELARGMVEDNGLADRVSLIRGTIENLELPEPVDVIVSETMGSFLLQEGGLPAVLGARQRLLRPGGKIIPAEAAMFLAPVELGEFHHSWVEAWTHELPEQLGLGFDVLRQACLRSSIRRSLAQEALLAPPGQLCRIDLLGGAPTDGSLRAELQFAIQRDAVLHGFAGSLEAKLWEGVSLKTHPGPATHWGQQVFPLPGLEVAAGDRLTAQVEVQPSPLTRRRVDVRIAYRLERAGAVIGEEIALFPQA